MPGNEIVMFEGYGGFGKHKRSRKRGSAKQAAARRRFGACAKSCRADSPTKYGPCMKTCLRKGRR